MFVCFHDVEGVFPSFKLFVCLSKAMQACWPWPLPSVCY